MVPLQIALAVFLAVPASFHPSTLSLSSSVRIHATDVSEPPAMHVQCKRSGSGWRCNRGFIEDAWVRDLVAETRIRLRRGDISRAGFPAARVSRIAAALRRDLRSDPQWNASERRAGLTLTTPSSVRSAIYASFYPKVRRASEVDERVVVRLKDSNGRTLTIESQNSTSQMLPWTLAYGDRRTTSLDARLSTLIARLLPTNDPNHDALTKPVPDPVEELVNEIDFRIIACRYDENPNDKAFCALTRAKTTP